MEMTSDVREALNHGGPVLALESTVIAHGMPFPENLETAQSLEKIVRDAGAIPATIAVLDGKPHIGLSPSNLERLAREGRRMLKLSRRDLPWVLAQNRSGATTVAATMILAARAGIRVFATGGIGGVHRNVSDTLDISADLPELTQSKVTVVSAGAKAILDLPKTLEYLETQGVPVVGYQTDEFPAFYSRESGLPAGLRADTPEEIAQMMLASDELQYPGGMLVANPVPEAYSVHPDQINPAIEQAIADAKKEKITGKRITPFLLERVASLTSGQSLVANIQLVLNNARLGAAIAGAFAKIS
jgi:pseudouridine-5'-phosphate glycosidase